MRGKLKNLASWTDLHYVVPGRILGIKGVRPEDSVAGKKVPLKVSLFDVSNKTAAIELCTWSLPGSPFYAMWHNRRFVYYRRRRMAVIPLVIRNAEGVARFSGAIVLRLSRKKIVEVGRLHHFVPGSRYHPPILRNLVIGDFLWSLSSQQLQVHKLGQLATRNRSYALDISDKIVLRLPSVAGMRISAAYTWAPKTGFSYSWSYKKWSAENFRIA